MQKDSTSSGANLPIPLLEPKGVGVSPFSDRVDIERIVEIVASMPRAPRIAFLLRARWGLNFDRIAVRMHVSRRRVRRYFITAIAHIDQGLRGR